MKRLLSVTMLAFVPVLAGCQFNPFAAGPRPPMYSTGAPCGYRAVDAGICPRVGYRVPAGASY
jgi:hypothetical protein